MFDKERKCHGVAYLLLQLLVILFNLSISTTTAQEISVSEIDGAFGVCTASMQGEALGNSELWKCNPRDQIVNLEVPNTTFSDMRPNYVRIKRCGGTCSSNLYKSCLATETREISVDVMLQPNNGEGSVCSTITEEEHVSCTCGCKTTADDCTPQMQRFVTRECKCICADTAAKIACQAQEYYWDETSCSCLCLPRTQWRTCHTGYAFNPTIDTCACVSISEIASSVLEILIVVLVSSMALITVGLIQCYRTRTGLFKEDPDVSRRVNETSSLRLTSIQRPPSGDSGGRSRHSTAGTPKFMTLNELRSLFRMLSRTSRSSDPSSPTSPTHRAPPSDGRSFLAPSCNYIPISEATSRSQSCTSVTTTVDDISSAAEASLLSSTASPNGPSRIPTICEALNELDDEEVNSSYDK